LKESEIVAMTLFSVFVIIGGFTLYSSVNDGFPCQKYVSYGYYIDYGDHETDTLQSGWIHKTVERKKQDQLQVLGKLTDLKLGKKGNVLSVNGVAADKSAGERWVIWEVDYFYGDDFEYDEYWDIKGVWKLTESPVDRTCSYSVYIGLVKVDPLTNAPLTTPYDKGIEAPSMPTYCC